MMIIIMLIVSIELHSLEKLSRVNSDSKHVHSSYLVPGALHSTLHMLTQSVLPSRHYWPPHVAKEGTELNRMKVK